MYCKVIRIYRSFYEYLAFGIEKYFILPKSLPKSNPCWFAYPFTIRDKIPFDRHEIVMFLEKKMITF